MKSLLVCAVAAAAILGAAAPSLAGNEKSQDKGGSDVGPQGQCFDSKVCGSGKHVMHHKKMKHVAKTSGEKTDEKH